MHKAKLIYSLAVLSSVALGSAYGGMVHADDSGTSSATTHQVTIDGKQIDTNPANTYKGFGMVSANGTSRLLLDYKAEHPDQYWQIMKKLFDPQTGALNFIKVEMGADVNTSTASTPATMRSENESANTLRGWDWHIVADAKKINPNLQVDMLHWSEPKWVSDKKADQKAYFAARYKWFKETLTSVYKTYGVKLNYISADKNETKSPDADWIIYLHNQLKNDKDTPYDFSQLKLVASDENGSAKLPTLMHQNADLRNAVDVISMHYQSHTQPYMNEMNDKYHKEIWYSEGIAPSGYAELRNNAEPTKQGLSGANSALDVLNTFINMYHGKDGTLDSSKDVSANMTRYEFQPPVSAFYDGGQYSSKTLIDAETPWSGNYYVDAGLPVTQQVSEFAKTGWQYVKNASEGISTGNNPYTSNSDNRLALTSPDKKDYSVVMTNESSQPRTYHYTLTNMPNPNKLLHVWQTSGPKSGQRYDANWLKSVGNVTPKKMANGTYAFDYTVPANSVVTLTTTTGQQAYQSQTNQKTYADDQLKLPYSDDFEYSDSKYQQYQDSSVLDSSKRGYLTSRDGTPRYFEDIGGSFQVVKSQDHGNVLQGMIDKNTHADGEWNAKDGNDTVMGDNRWANYQFSSDLKLDDTNDGNGTNYASLLVRNLITQGGSKSLNDTGYQFRIYKDGTAKLIKDQSEVAKTTLKSFDASKWHHARVVADGNTITAYLDNQKALSYTDKSSAYATGKVGLNTNYSHGQFDNVKVEPINGKAPFVQRYDDADSIIKYEGDWKHSVPTGFQNFNRTLSTSANGALSFDIKGIGFNLNGATDPANLKVTVDGKVVADNQAISQTGNRATSYSLNGLSDGTHHVTVQVLKGNFSVDAIDADAFLANESNNENSNNNQQSNTNSGSSTTSSTPVNSTSSSTTSATSSSTVTSSGSGNSTTTSTSQPTKPAAKSTNVKIGESVYAVKKIYLYKAANFKPSQRIASYSKRSRVNRPTFVVKGLARSSQGRLRFQVKDTNRHSQTYGKTGYVTANRKYIIPVYEKRLPKSKTILVISKKGLNAYRTVKLRGKIKHYKHGQSLRVKVIKKDHLVTRYQLINGHYVTANKKFVMAKTD